MAGAYIDEIGKRHTERDQQQAEERPKQRGDPGDQRRYHAPAVAGPGRPVHFLLVLFPRLFQLALPHGGAPMHRAEEGEDRRAIGDQAVDQHIAVQRVRQPDRQGNHIKRNKAAKTEDQGGAGHVLERGQHRN